MVSRPPWLLEGPDEGCLADADAGDAGQYAEVAGEPEAPRIGEPLAVADQQVGRHLEFAEGIQ